MSSSSAATPFQMIDSERISLVAGTIEPEEDRALDDESGAEPIVELAPEDYVELPSGPPPFVPSRRRTVPVLFVSRAA